LRQSPFWKWRVRWKPVKCICHESQVHVRPGLEKRALVVRLRRKSKGQIEGIEKMMEADTDCSDVLMQVVSARRALKSFSEEGPRIPVTRVPIDEHHEAQSEGRRELNCVPCLPILKSYAV
jgi:hypothetical protein